MYVSSISALFHPGGPVLLTADTPVAPATRPYAASKAACERYARELQARGAPVVCVYPGGVLGPDDPSGSEAMRGPSSGGGSPWSGSTADICSSTSATSLAVIAAALTPGLGPRRYLAGHHYVPWTELCDLVAEVTGRPVHRPPIPGRLLRWLGSAGDVVHRVIPFSFPLSREAMETASLMVPMDDQATIDELGVEFRPAARDPARRLPVALRQRPHPRRLRLRSPRPPLLATNYARRCAASVAGAG